MFIFNQYTIAPNPDVGSLPPIRYDCSAGAVDQRVLARTWRDSTGVVYVAFVFPDARRLGHECQVIVMR